jgi:ankyrin repeat protein
MIARLTVLTAVIVLALAMPAAADWSPFGKYWDNIARATKANDAAQVRSLLTDGHSPNETDEAGRSGLIIAAGTGNLQIAAILIKGGAQLDLRDPPGNTALFYAADRDQVEMAKLLIDCGAAVDIQNHSGLTPLMAAARHGDLEIVQALLAKGANPAKSDFTGRDAIGWAADSRKQAVAQALRRAMAKR